MSAETGQQEVQAMAAGAVRLYTRKRSRAGTHRPGIQWAVVPLPLVDMTCIVSSMLAAYWLRFQVMEYYSEFSSAFYTHLGVVAVLTWIFLFAFYRLYSVDHLFSGVQEYGNVINACTMGLMGLVVYSFLNRGIHQDISRGWLAIVWLLSISSLELARFSYRRVIFFLRRNGLFLRRALVVGINDEGREVTSQLRHSPNAGVEVVGFIDAGIPSGTTLDELPILGALGSLETHVRRLGIDELIVIPTAIGREKLLEIYRDWSSDSGVEIHLSSGLYELFTTGVKVNEIGSVPLVSINRTRITGLDASLKAITDHVLALLAIALLWPLFLIIAILIRLNSPGPVIYRRRVVGLHGCEFDAFKFRTMVINAESHLEACPELKKEWEETGKIKDDPRITRIGSLLRRFSLDELPQLLNVLRGEMSLVGPRMITPPEMRHFGRWQHNLLTVKPGMTGLWQISGRSDVSYDERVRLDMYYIRNHTMWLDLKVLMHTVSAVLAGRGAY